MVVIVAEPVIVSAPELVSPSMIPTVPVAPAKAPVPPAMLPGSVGVGTVWFADGGNEREKLKLSTGFTCTVAAAILLNGGELVTSSGNVKVPLPSVPAVPA